MSFNQKIFLFIALFFIGLFALVGWIFRGRSVQNSSPQNSSQLPVAPAISSTLFTQTSTTAGMKTYRNMEWGFEFQYPLDWVVSENSFKNYYSKFNLEIVPPGKIELFDPAVINIVLPGFADRTFLDLGAATSTISVSNILGIKYEYKFEGLSYIAIVLPFGQNKMIIGTKKKYEDIFRQIITSFKFIRK